MSKTQKNGPVDSASTGAPRSRSSDVVSVACKLPNGLRVVVPDAALALNLVGSQDPYARFGYGITNGVRREDWEAIVRCHGNAKWLKNELVFALPDADSVQDRAAEMQDERSGFEPIPQLDNDTLTVS